MKYGLCFCLFMTHFFQHCFYFSSASFHNWDKSLEKSIVKWKKSNTEGNTRKILKPRDYDIHELYTEMKGNKSEFMTVIISGEIEEENYNCII